MTDLNTIRAYCRKQLNGASETDLEETRAAIQAALCEWVGTKDAVTLACLASSPPIGLPAVQTAGALLAGTAIIDDARRVIGDFWLTMLMLADPAPGFANDVRRFGLDRVAALVALDSADSFRDHEIKLLLRWARSARHAPLVTGRPMGRATQSKEAASRANRAWDAARDYFFANPAATKDAAITFLIAHGYGASRSVLEKQIRWAKDGARKLALEKLARKSVSIYSTSPQKAQRTP